MVHYLITPKREGLETEYVRTINHFWVMLVVFRLQPPHQHSRKCFPTVILIVL